jgi:hypothetical protein
MLASRTAGQVIGWLLVASPLLALGRLQRRLAELSAAGIAFSAGAAILYVAYFEWGTPPSFPEANAAERVLAATPGPVSMPVALKIRETVVPLPVPAPAPRAAPAVLAAEPQAIPYSPPY